MARNSTLLARNATSAAEVVTDLVFNVAPIRFRDHELAIEVLLLQNQRQLDALRAQHHLTHMFHREAGTRVLCVPVAHNVSPLGTAYESIRLSENLSLCASLIRNALLNYLQRQGRPSLTADPIEIRGNASNENLLAAAIPYGCPAWLGVKPSYRLSVRVFQWEGQAAFVGLALDVGAQFHIDLSCEELAAEGISLLDLWAGPIVEQADRRLAARLEAWGQIQQVNQGRLQLRDPMAQMQTMEASSAHLLPSEMAFDRCFRHVFREHAIRIRPEMDRQIAAFLSGPRRLQKLQTIIERLGRLPLEMAPGIPFTIGPFFAQNGEPKSTVPRHPPVEEEGTESKPLFPVLHEVSKPLYVFDPDGQHTHLSKDRGLREYGPYAVPRLPSHPHVGVICQGYRRDQVEALVDKWLHGIPASKREKSLFPIGFLQQYGLENLSLHFFEVRGDTPQAYGRATHAAIDHQRQNGRPWDLALVQTHESWQGLKGAQNPYRVAQALLLAHEVPTHEVPIEAARLRDRPLSYILNTMALACYAKMGGIPWLLETSPSPGSELVVGLGAGVIGARGSKPEQSLLPISTVFSGDGDFQFSRSVPLVPTADYTQSLLSTLPATRLQVNSPSRKPSCEPVRLIFHALHQEPGISAKIVRQLKADLGESVTELAFLHIVQDHPYRLFDRRQRGVQHFPSRLMQGTYTPPRGCYLFISDHEALLFLTGAKQVQSPLEGLPPPLLLRLDPASTFRDMKYLVQQVFALSCHWWHSFSPASLPVTVGYVERIQQGLHQLAMVPGARTDPLLGSSRQKMWFL